VSRVSRGEGLSANLKMERMMEAVAAKSLAANYDVICMLRSRMRAKYMAVLHRARHCGLGRYINLALSITERACAGAP
jgi:hypothetical protein